ncbi:MAG TPA: hypothetical protein VN408_08705 [Actinoplanes sp.]|nr:hypothetical protein [Actinoplanes sp.]
MEGVEVPPWGRFDGLTIGWVVLLVDAVVLGLVAVAGFLILMMGGFSVPRFLASWAGIVLLAVSCVVMSARLAAKVTRGAKLLAIVLTLAVTAAVMIYRNESGDYPGPLLLLAILNGVAAAGIALPRRDAQRPAS